MSSGVPSELEEYSNAVTLAQKFLNEAMIAAKATQSKYERSTKIRRMLAIALKAIALFGGLAVATGWVNQTVLGVVISAAVLLDQLLSNHSRLLSEGVAANAVARTMRIAENSFNYNLVKVIEIRDKGKQKAAAQKLIQLAQETAKTVNDELNRIHTAVEKSDIEFLSRLNIEQTAPVTRLTGASG